MIKIKNLIYKIYKLIIFHKAKPFIFFLFKMLSCYLWYCMMQNLISKESVDVVFKFKLLGLTIDDNSVSFSSHINNLKKAVNTRLFSISKLFYLSFNLKLQFFKTTFILPHFYYCNSLIIYINDTVLNQIEKLYNFCIFNVLKKDIYIISLEQQLIILSELRLLPYINIEFFIDC